MLENENFKTVLDVLDPESTTTLRNGNVKEIMSLPNEILQKHLFFISLTKIMTRLAKLQMKE